MPSPLDFLDAPPDHPLIVVRDSPDGRLRVVEFTGFQLGDIHEMKGHRRPLVLDRARRAVVLDMRERCTDATTELGADGTVRIRAAWNISPPPLDLTIDVVVARFRDGEQPWQPLGELDRYLEGRVPSWGDIEAEPWSAAVRRFAFPALAWLAIAGILAWVVWHR